MDAGAATFPPDGARAARQPRLSGAGAAQGRRQPRRGAGRDDGDLRAARAGVLATNEKRSAEVSPLANEVFQNVRPAVSLLFGAVALVLLIACANVASLLLARSEARRREMSLRRALGADDRQLVRLLLIESALLVMLGGGARLGARAVDGRRAARV